MSEILDIDTQNGNTGVQRTNVTLFYNKCRI